MVSSQLLDESRNQLNASFNKEPENTGINQTNGIYTKTQGLNSPETRLTSAADIKANINFRRKSHKTQANNEPDGLAAYSPPVMKNSVYNTNINYKNDLILNDDLKEMDTT